MSTLFDREVLSGLSEWVGGVGSGSEVAEERKRRKGDYRSERKRVGKVRGVGEGGNEEVNEK